MTFDEWLKQGYDNGWVGPAVCYNHDGLPTSEEEDADFDDACLHIVRLYESPEMKKAVEVNHAPSLWRASNQGW